MALFALDLDLLANRMDGMILIARLVALRVPDVVKANIPSNRPEAIFTDPSGSLMRRGAIDVFTVAFRTRRELAPGLRRHEASGHQFAFQSASASS